MNTSNRYLWHRQLFILLAAVVVVAAACGPGTPITGSAPPTDWPQPNHDLANTRVASGSPISSHNVQQLGVDWTFKVAASAPYGAIATSPIVVGSTVYFQDLTSNVYAVDLGTGTLLWQKQNNAPSLGPNGVG